VSASGVVFTPPDLAREVATELDQHAPGAVPVLDPTCGDGALLAAVLERRGNDPRVARTALFGIEVDPELAERARARLRTLAGLAPGTELDGHIVCADALTSGRGWRAGTHVLANPPWVSFSGRQSACLDQLGPGRNRHATAEPRSGWPSLHGAFLERIAEHVRTERTSARVILPAQVTGLERYGPLRRAVTRLARLAGPPRELGEDRFGAVIGPAVVLALVPHPSPRRGDGGSEASWSGSSSETEALRAQLQQFPRLDRRRFADPGVHTGNTARELVFDASGPERTLLRIGRDLVPYKLGAPSRFLRTDLVPDPSGSAGEPRRFRIAPLERYRSFPVLVRQTANRPLAALHTEPTYFRNSLLATREVPGLDPAFVVGVLNGPVATAWHRARWQDARQRAFPQVKVAHLASQPFPIATRAERPALHDELADRVRGLLHRAGAAFDRERRAVEALALAAFELPPEVREQVRTLNQAP